LRRAGAKVKADNPDWQGDTGFRVFKLDTSNIRAWNPKPDDLEATLFDHQDHLLEGRSEADVLYELLLKLGLDLCVPIEKRSIEGLDVHAVGGGVLLACLAEKITREQVEPLAQGIIAWHKELAPAGDTTCARHRQPADPARRRAAGEPARHPAAQRPARLRPRCSGDFTVEMETGTGKTYVYLRTIFELNKRYGFTKFVIVVPSVAIKEGVYKTLQITARHFKGLYAGVPFDYFLYDSAKLGQVRNFATSPNIQIMVVTVGAINKKDVNNLYKDSEKTGRREAHRPDPRDPPDPDRGRAAERGRRPGRPGKKALER
jgi:hypothetical protein